MSSLKKKMKHTKVTVFTDGKQYAFVLFQWEDSDLILLLLLAIHSGSFKTFCNPGVSLGLYIFTSRENLEK